MTEPFADIRASVAAANNKLAAAGLAPHTFGNVSQVDRDDGVFAIKPTGIACGDVASSDIVVVALDDGRRIWGEYRPSSDTPTHRVLYEQLDGVGGVVHTHSMYATAWAQARSPVPCLGTTHADHFRGSIPITRDLTSEEIGGDYEANTGQVIVELYGNGAMDPEEAPGVLVACHGPFAWGLDAAAAVKTAAVMEFLAELAARTVAISPGPAPIDGHLLDRHFNRKHGATAYYGQS